MKILVVDDEQLFVKFVTGELRKAGLDVDGIAVGWEMMTPDGQDLADGDVLALVRKADVIFLDHNMPNKNGEELLKYWQELGIDISAKRVISTSSDNQRYLSEQINAMNLRWPDVVKKTLGID